MVWSLKHINDLLQTPSFSLHKTLIDGQLWWCCGLLWCIYELLSFWWHPFTAEDPLESKWCNATFLQICSNKETSSSTPRTNWGWVNVQQMFIFGVTISLFCSFIQLTASTVSRGFCLVWKLSFYVATSQSLWHDVIYLELVVVTFPTVLGF